MILRTTLHGFCPMHQIITHFSVFDELVPNDRKNIKKEINSKLCINTYCDVMFDYVWNTARVSKIYEHQSQ